MGYYLILSAVAFIMASAGGACLYFSWRYVDRVQITNRTLPFALASGFIFWFFCGLISVFFPGPMTLAVRFFGGNGWYMATFIAMMGMLLHFQLLNLMTKK